MPVNPKNKRAASRGHRRASGLTGLAAVALLMLQACTTTITTTTPPPAPRTAPGTVEGPAASAEHVQLTSSYVSNGGTGPRFESIPLSVIQQKDTLYVLTHVNWQPVDQDLGKHHVNWNWYAASGERVAAREMDLHFKQSPYRFWYRFGAAALPVGKYRVEVLLDGRKLSETDFSIAP